MLEAKAPPVVSKPPPSLPPGKAPPPPPQEVSQPVAKKAPPAMGQIAMPPPSGVGPSGSSAPPRGAPGAPAGPPPKAAKSKAKASKPGPPPPEAMHPLPQQKSGTRGLKGAPAVSRTGFSDNAASGPKWAERPVEKLSASAAYYEEEEDPELAKYIWDRKAQKPRNDAARAAPKPMQARVQVPVAMPPLRAAPPNPQKQRQMLVQVMDMGFDEPTAKRALSSSGWGSVEDAIQMLLG